VTESLLHQINVGGTIRSDIGRSWTWPLVPRSHLFDSEGNLVNFRRLQRG